MTLEFTAERSYEDYLTAHRLSWRKSWTAKSIIQAAVLAGILAIPATAVGYAMAGFWPNLSEFFRSYINTLIIMVPAMALFAGLLWLLIGSLANNAFNDEGKVDLPTRFEFDTDGFSWSNQLASCVRTWHPSMDIIENSRVLAIRRSSLIVLVLPKAQLDDKQLREIHSILQQAGVRAA